MEKTIPTRKDIQAADTWNLGDIFPSDEAWEAEFAALSGEKNALSRQYQGKLAQGRDTVLAALQLQFELLERLGSLMAYAELSKSEDNGNPAAQARSERISTLYAQWSADAAFFQPEMLTLPEAELKGYISDTGFSDYAVYLKDILREKPHTLDAAQEKMLRMAGEVFMAQGNVFDMFAYVDLQFPDVPNEQGEPSPLTEGSYSQFLYSGNREVRRQAFQALLGTYGKWRNTLAATYVASVKQDVFAARVRGHEGARRMALFPDQVPDSVYDGLIGTVHEFIPVLDRYTALRRTAFDIPEVHLYDLYASMAPAFDIKLPFEEAYAQVVEALGVLGEDYQQVLRQARQNRWMDIYENRGKTTGAFSHGEYRAHPYVLLNYRPGLRDILTIAHEMGHAMHSYYSNRTQPFPQADYTIFAAEVASTVNEVLLLEYLLDKHPEAQAQAALLGQLLEGFRSTVFRQTMFAEFESRVHAMAELDEPLTAEVLEVEYFALNQAYYGGAAVVDEEIRHEWSRIPHFYRAFYVYKYATGFTAATALARRLRTGGEQALKEYRTFLSLGGSVPPIEALRVAGVDMSTQEPIRQSLRYFEELLQKFSGLQESRSTRQK